MFVFRDADRIILEVVKTNGPGSETFNTISKQLRDKTPQQVSWPVFLLYKFLEKLISWNCHFAVRFYESMFLWIHYYLLVTNFS